LANKSPIKPLNAGQRGRLLVKIGNLGKNLVEFRSGAGLSGRRHPWNRGGSRTGSFGQAICRFGNGHVRDLLQRRIRSRSRHSAERRTGCIGSGYTNLEDYRNFADFAG
jgi:hypothetical protein